jgi:hypothetical protein
LAWAAFGTKERSGSVGWLPAHAREKSFLFLLTLFTKWFNLNSNSNLNPLKQIQINPNEKPTSHTSIL